MNTFKSPLENIHLKFNAKMMDFAGWQMPLNYTSGIKNEHLFTRKNAGLFEISHMGQIILKGDGSEGLLNELTPTEINAINPRKVKYSFFLNKSGGIIDDIMITKDQDLIYLVVNASRTNIDLKLLTKTKNKFPKVSIIHLSDYGMIALQGPKSEKILSTVFKNIHSLNFMESSVFTYENNKIRISRSGYTGEDGFEISAPKNCIEKIVEKILTIQNVTLCGLGSRDTLRLEAGLPLYGNELNENTNPVESGVDFALSRNRIQLNNYRGSKRINEELKTGSKKIIVGIVHEGKQPIRKGQILLNNSHKIGVITSGGYSPSLEKPISMAIINKDFAEPNTIVKTIIREKEVLLKVTSLPFVPHKYKRKK